MIIGTEDTITPPGPQRAAALRGGAELAELPCRHFDTFRAASHLPHAIERSAEFLRGQLA